MWLVDGVKQIFLFLSGGRSERFFNDLLGHNAAFAALAHHAQLLANFTQARGATKDRVFDLVVGDSFAEAHVHDELIQAIGLLLAIELIVGVYGRDINGNENCCQLVLRVFLICI